MRALLGTIAVVFGLATLAAQEPALVIQNGTVETRTTASIDAAIGSVGPSDEATWVLWREPMVEGDRHLCSTWSDGDTFVRGLTLEPRQGTDGRPVLATPAGPSQLEAGTGVLVLARVVDGRVERLRVASDDCPIDANGRTVVRLTAVTAAESLRYLSSFTTPASLTTSARSSAQAATTAIALHRDAGADAILDRLFAPGAEPDLRDNAARALALYRGRHGYDAVRRAIDAEHDASTRQRLVAALRLSREPEAPAALLQIARTDASEHVRAEAIQGYAALSGNAGLQNVVGVATSDASADVQRRAVSSLSRLTPDVGVPALLSLARTSTNATIRKEAVGALSRVDDPRATAYLKELIAP